MKANKANGKGKKKDFMPTVNIKIVQRKEKLFSSIKTQSTSIFKWHKLLQSCYSKNRDQTKCMPKLFLLSKPIMRFPKQFMTFHEKIFLSKITFK